jgi:hypothetical protein
MHILLHRNFINIIIYAIQEGGMAAQPPASSLAQPQLGAPIGGQLGPQQAMQEQMAGPSRALGNVRLAQPQIQSELHILLAKSIACIFLSNLKNLIKFTYVKKYILKYYFLISC